LGWLSRLAISIICPNGEHGLLATTHGSYPEVPSFDYLRLAQGKLKLVAAIEARR
jgi:hypothetical protein